jgi:hypothetical protein
LTCNIAFPGQVYDYHWEMESEAGRIWHLGGHWRPWFSLSPRRWVTRLVITLWFVVSHQLTQLNGFMLFKFWQKVPWWFSSLPPIQNQLDFSIFLFGKGLLLWSECLCLLRNSDFGP